MLGMNKGSEVEALHERGQPRPESPERIEIQDAKGPRCQRREVAAR